MVVWLVCVRPGEYHVSSHCDLGQAPVEHTVSTEGETEQTVSWQRQRGRKGQREREQVERERRKKARGSRDHNLEYGSLNSTLNPNFNMFIINFGSDLIPTAHGCKETVISFPTNTGA